MDTRGSLGSQPGTLGDAARAVLCLPGDDTFHPVRALVEGQGLAVVSEVDRGLDALAAAVEQHADLVVLELTLVGTLGLRLLALLRMAVPDAAIVAISPFEALVEPALEAGATAVLTDAEVPELARRLADLGLSP